MSSALTDSQNHPVIGNGAWCGVAAAGESASQCFGSSDEALTQTLDTGRDREASNKQGAYCDVTASGLDDSVKETSTCCRCNAHQYVAACEKLLTVATTSLPAFQELLALTCIKLLPYTVL